jgi:DNA-binding NarL/FixJ family response regulator
MAAWVVRSSNDTNFVVKGEVMFTGEQWNRIFEDTDLKDSRQQVVKLALSGFSNKQIAGHMKIGIKAVEYNMVRTFHALQVANIRELFAWIINKYLSVPPNSRHPQGSA